MACSKIKHNLTGKRFGKLLVKELAYVKHGAHWRCLCDCGDYTISRTDSLLRSHGVHQCKTCSSEAQKVPVRAKDRRIHGIWCAMMQRCYNPNTIGWANYGGRGIEVWFFWHKFDGFYASMGDPPTLHHSLDRIDNNESYAPWNCRWATRSEQQGNKRNTLFLEYAGQRQTLKEWAAETGIHPGTLESRYRKGWPVKDLLTMPVNKRRSQTTTSLTPPPL